MNAQELKAQLQGVSDCARALADQIGDNREVSLDREALRCWCTMLGSLLASLSEATEGGPIPPR